ncbi:glycosyl hydrolase family 95 catalytic domain-containing protein [Niabella hirudinis]|uniref:glycosyl hydrolase family 95 catalytic domain-containing protein n=1 Tax=Niabella hirudinis TaxID=1285929 RepID=UPI003EBAD473
MKRKNFLQQTGMMALGAAIFPKDVLAGTQGAQQMFEVDHSALLARAAIRYFRPVSSNDEGLPIGNGQMGTFVWTEKSDTTDGAKIMYQINRNDTFGMDRTHKHYDPKVLSGQNVETTDNALSLCRVGICVEKAAFRSQVQNTKEGTISFEYKGDSGLNDMMMYLPLYAANQMELTDAYLGMYRRMLPDCEVAARQRWGVTKGAFVPEAVGPSGPVILSDQAAPMVREVLAGKRTRASLPPEVILECLSETTLDWINPKYGSVRNDHFSYLSHILSSGAQLAMQFYWRYQMTGDINWLRESAYPMMKSMVDFYQDYAQKGADGYFHILPANVHESYWGVKDGIVDLAAIRSLTPKVIACSKILGVDADHRKGWEEFVRKIAAYPAGNAPDVVRLQTPEDGPGPRGASIPLFPAGTFGAGYALSCVGRQNVDPVWMWPLYPFEDVSLVRGRFTGMPEEKADFQKMQLTYANLPPTFYGFPWPSYAPRLGLADEVRKLLPLYVATIQQTPNGLQRSWGQANLGLSAEALQSALMQSVDGTIIIAPAWPAEWRADFTLLARGGFLVSASLEKGAPRCVQIESTFGKDCRLLNPWFPAPAFLIAAGKTPKKSNKQIIEFSLEPGEKVLLVKDPEKMPQLPIKIKPGSGPAVKTLEVINAKGQPVKRQLGKA